MIITGGAYIPCIFQEPNTFILFIPLPIEQITIKGAEILLHEQGNIFPRRDIYIPVIGALDQDLIVYAFTRKGRIECTNYRNVNIPTDKNVPLFVQKNFGA